MKARSTYLVLISTSTSKEPTDSPPRFVLSEGRSTLGRSRESTICLADRTVSREHCAIEKRSANVVVFPLSEKNGTWVGSQRVETDGTRLRDGDVLRVGRCRFAFRAPEQRAATKTKPPSRSPDRPTHRRRRRPASHSVWITVASAVAAIALIAIAVELSRDDPVADPSESSLGQDDRLLAKAVETPEPGSSKIASPAPSKRSPTNETPSRAGEPLRELIDTTPSTPQPEPKKDELIETAAIVPTAAKTEAVLEPTVEPETEIVATPNPEQPLTYYDTHVVPYLRKYCVNCHGKRRKKGGLSVEQWADVQAATQARSTWEDIALKIRNREMPPEEKRQPDPSETAAVLTWIEREVLKIDLAGAKFRCKW
ncbi:MAG: FHA domain-containing protein [Planctomycetota bacterium]